MLTDENGLNLSQRNVTVSTCGLVPRMRDMAQEHLAVTLAVSLHAADQEKRERLMPVAQRWDIDDVFDACAYYFEETGRRVTLEYCLIAGVNDTPRDASELARRAADLHCHVNLIPVNPVRESGCRKPGRDRVGDFKERLERGGVNATVRRSLGSDIDGACGQLRKRYTG